MMRQLRVQSKACSNPHLISRCENDYSLFNEEKQSFYPGWTNETDGGQYSSSILKSFQYQSNDNLNTYYTIGQHGIYSGNGYVYEYRGSLSNLKSNLSSLHELEWIDQRTRAIIIQMTLYNPNVQLLISVTLLSEFLSTGGVFTSARFEPLQFYGIINHHFLKSERNSFLFMFSVWFFIPIDLYNYLYGSDYLLHGTTDSFVHENETEILSRILVMD